MEVRQQIDRVDAIIDNKKSAEASSLSEDEAQNLADVYVNKAENLVLELRAIHEEDYLGEEIEQNLFQLFSLVDENNFVRQRQKFDEKISSWLGEVEEYEQLRGGLLRQMNDENNLKMFSPERRQRLVPIEQKSNVELSSLIEEINGNKVIFDKLNGIIGNKLNLNFSEENVFTYFYSYLENGNTLAIEDFENKVDEFVNLSEKFVTLSLLIFEDQSVVNFVENLKLDVLGYLTNNNVDKFDEIFSDFYEMIPQLQWAESLEEDSRSIVSKDIEIGLVVQEIQEITLRKRENEEKIEEESRVLQGLIRNYNSPILTSSDTDASIVRMQQRQLIDDKQRDLEGLRQANLELQHSHLEKEVKKLDLSIERFELAKNYSEKRINLRFGHLEYLGDSSFYLESRNLNDLIDTLNIPEEEELLRNLIQQHQDNYYEGSNEGILRERAEISYNHENFYNERRFNEFLLNPLESSSNQVFSYMGIRTEYLDENSLQLQDDIARLGSDLEGMDVAVFDVTQERDLEKHMEGKFNHVIAQERLVLVNLEKDVLNGGLSSFQFSEIRERYNGNLSTRFGLRNLGNTFLEPESDFFVRGASSIDNEISKKYLDLYEKQYNSFLEKLQELETTNLLLNDVDFVSVREVLFGEIHEDMSEIYEVLRRDAEIRELLTVRQGLVDRASNDPDRNVRERAVAELENFNENVQIPEQNFVNRGMDEETLQRYKLIASNNLEKFRTNGLGGAYDRVLSKLNSLEELSGNTQMSRNFGGMFQVYRQFESLYGRDNQFMQICENLQELRADTWGEFAKEKGKDLVVIGFAVGGAIVALKTMGAATPLVAGAVKSVATGMFGTGVIGLKVAGTMGAASTFLSSAAIGGFGSTIAQEFGSGLVGRGMNFDPGHLYQNWKTNTLTSAGIMAGGAGLGAFLSRSGAGALSRGLGRYINKANRIWDADGNVMRQFRSEYGQEITQNISENVLPPRAAFVVALIQGTRARATGTGRGGLSSVQTNPTLGQTGLIELEVLSRITPVSDSGAILAYDSTNPAQLTQTLQASGFTDVSVNNGVVQASTLVDGTVYNYEFVQTNADAQIRTYLLSDSGLNLKTKYELNFNEQSGKYEYNNGDGVRGDSYRTNFLTELQSDGFVVRNLPGGEMLAVKGDLTLRLEPSPAEIARVEAIKIIDGSDSSASPAMRAEAESLRRFVDAERTAASPLYDSFLRGETLTFDQQSLLQRDLARYERNRSFSPDGRLSYPKAFKDLASDFKAVRPRIPREILTQLQTDPSGLTAEQRTFLQNRLDISASEVTNPDVVRRAMEAEATRIAQLGEVLTSDTTSILGDGHRFIDLKLEQARQRIKLYGFAEVPSIPTDLTLDQALGPDSSNFLHVQQRLELEAFRDSVLEQIIQNNPSVSQEAQMLTASLTNELMSVAQDAQITVHQAAQLVQSSIENIVYQTIESDARSMGGHGIEHIYGNIHVSNQLFNLFASQENSTLSARERLQMYITQINHDMGYTASVALRGFPGTKIHPFTSELMFTDTQRTLMTDIFGGDGVAEIQNLIRNHDAADFNMGSNFDTLASIVQLADNSALFSIEKLPPVFARDPRMLNLLAQIQYVKNNDLGKYISESSIRGQFYSLIDTIVAEGKSSPFEAASLRAAVQEINLTSSDFTLGMVAGRFSNNLFNFNSDTNVLTMNMEAVSSYDAMSILQGGEFDARTQAFLKVINDYREVSGQKQITPQEFLDSVTEHGSIVGGHVDVTLALSGGMTLRMEVNSSSESLLVAERAKRGNPSLEVMLADVSAEIAALPLTPETYLKYRSLSDVRSEIHAEMLTERVQQTQRRIDTFLTQEIYSDRKGGLNLRALMDMDSTTFENLSNEQRLRIGRNLHRLARSTRNLAIPLNQLNLAMGYNHASGTISSSPSFVVFDTARNNLGTDLVRTLMQ
jgi:hypothetical protein